MTERAPQAARQAFEVVSSMDEPLKPSEPIAFPAAWSTLYAKLTELARRQVNVWWQKEFIPKFAPRLERWTRGKVGTDDARDCVQVALSGALQTFDPQFQEQGTAETESARAIRLRRVLEAYCFTGVRLACLSVWHSRQRDARLEEGLALNVQPNTPAPQLADGSGSIRRLAFPGSGSGHTGPLETAMNRLSAAQRAIVLLTDAFELTPLELARWFVVTRGIPPHAAKQDDLQELLRWLVDDSLPVAADELSDVDARKRLTNDEQASIKKIANRLAQSLRHARIALRLALLRPETLPPAECAATLLFEIYAFTPETLAKLIVRAVASEAEQRSDLASKPLGTELDEAAQKLKWSSAELLAALRLEQVWRLATLADGTGVRLDDLADCPVPPVESDADGARLEFAQRAQQELVQHLSAIQRSARAAIRVRYYNLSKEL